MLFMDLSNCGPSGLLRVIYFFKLILNVVFTIIPIALIIMLMVDFAKMTISGDENEQSKTFKLATKRIMYAVIVFCIPWIVSVLNAALGSLGVDYAACYYDVTMDAINELAATEEKIEEAQKRARQKQLEEQRKKEEEEEKIRGYFNSNNVYLAIGQGCDGMVYYENGNFYKPSGSYKNGTPETKGSAPYGYNKYFYEMLNKMVEDAKAAGHTIKMSTTEYGAWRPYENQVYFYDCYINKNCNNGNLAAKPGTSNHGWGIASDLSYGNSSDITWAHENAKNYGLAFTVTSENWHIAPAIEKVDDSVVTKCS